MGKKKNKKSRDVKATKRRTESRSRVFAKFKVELGRLSPAFGIVLLCTSVVFLASWVGLFDLLKIDSLTERMFVKYADAFTYENIDPNVVLITAVEDPQGNGTLGRPDSNWRRYHAALIDALAQAKAKVVAFDLFFEDSSDGDDDFGRAIRRATHSGTTVVIGVRDFNIHEGLATPSLTPVLRKTLEERNWGFLEVGGADKGTVAVRKLRLAQEINTDSPPWTEAQEPKVVPSFTLQVLRAGLSPEVGTAFYAKKEGQLKLPGGNGQVVKSIPVDEGINFIVNERETAALDKINHPYQEVYNNRGNSDYLTFFFKDKIVIIGYKVKQDSPGVADGDSTYGVEIQASALSDLLKSVHISKLQPVFSFLAIAVMSSIGILIGKRHRHVMRPKIRVHLGVVTFHIGLPLLLFAITAAYLLVAVVLYKYNRVLLGIPYHVAVLFLTFGLADRIESRKTGRNK